MYGRSKRKGGTITRENVKERGEWIVCNDKEIKRTRDLERRKEAFEISKKSKVDVRVGKFA